MKVLRIAALLFSNLLWMPLAPAVTGQDADRLVGTREPVYCVSGIPGYEHWSSTARAEARQASGSGVLRPTFMMAAAGDEQRIRQCLTCCAQKSDDCIKKEGRGGRCSVEYENCVAQCNAKGEVPANWSCWPRR